MARGNRNKTGTTLNFRTIDTTSPIITVATSGDEVDLGVDIDELGMAIDVQYRTELDDVGGGVSFLGQAVPGTATSAALWRIKRITETGPDIEIIFADGDEPGRSC